MTRDPDVEQSEDAVPRVLSGLQKCELKNLNAVPWRWIRIEILTSDGRSIQEQNRTEQAIRQLYDAATSFGARIQTPMLIYTIFIYDKTQNIS